MKHEYDLRRDVPFDFDEEQFGELVGSMQMCPCVYYVATKVEEYYVVLLDDNAGIISKQALEYGMPIGNTRVYVAADHKDGGEIIHFETLCYMTEHGLPLPKTESLFACAHYNALDYPEYFGEIPPPRDTPYGPMLRYIYVDRGIYFVQSDQCVWMLAVCYPIADAEFSDYVKKIAEHTEDENRGGVDKSLAYFYFRAEQAAPAIYELLILNDELLKFIESKEALYAALNQNFAKYVMVNNMQVQAGMGPGALPGRILELYDETVEYTPDSSEFIPYTEDENLAKSYLKLPQ